MGTKSKTYKLIEADYRGERFANFGRDVKGNNDLLVLTQPHIIRDIHRSYLEAGADIIETNSFNGTQIRWQTTAWKISFMRLTNPPPPARQVCDEVTAINPEKPRFVAGVIGPTSRTCSISPDVNDPAFRNVTFR